MLSERCPRCLGPLGAGAVLSLFDHATQVCGLCSHDENHHRNEFGWVPDLSFLLVDGIPQRRPNYRNFI